MVVRENILKVRYTSFRSDLFPGKAYTLLEGFFQDLLESIFVWVFYVHHYYITSENEHN